MPKSINLEQVSTMMSRLRTLGVRRSIQGALSLIDDRRFDRRYGTDTLIRGDLESLDVTTASRDHAVAYAATRSRHFAAVMRACSFPTDSVFVDIGSGKGKVLLLASRYHFKRVIGVEFSPQLCRIARTNLAAFEQIVPSRTPVEVIEADVSEHQFGADENVFFLFNPFDDAILSRFIGNLERSLERHPRRVWVLYHYPKRRALFDSHPLCRLEQSIVYGNSESLVYTMSFPRPSPTNARTLP